MEDLNHTADGGLYGELIRNRAFEFSSCDNENYTPLTAWEKVGNPEAVYLQIAETDPVCKENPHYLCMETMEENAGVWNVGYNSGIFLEKDKKYRFSCYARCEKTKNMVITVALCGENQKKCGSCRIYLTDQWQKYEMVLESENTDVNGRVALLTEKPGVFLGEYASRGNEWFHALAEASYMIGLERNADKVFLACYAPLFCNVDYVNWDHANLIWFDNHRRILTASYYVQKLFMNHQGDRQLPCVIETKETVEDWSYDPGFVRGEICLGTNETHVHYSNIRVENKAGDCLLQKESCTVKPGESVYLGTVEEKQYRILLSAKQLSEEGEGFSVIFGKKDKDNQMILSLGGWNKANNTLDEIIDGTASTLSQYPFFLCAGQEYEVEIQIDGGKIAVRIDGEKCYETERSLVMAEPVYCSASVENDTGDLILKFVNITSKTRSLRIFLGENSEYDKGRAFIMSGYDREEKNTFENPDRIKPKEKNIHVQGKYLEFLAEKESFAVVRLGKKTGGKYENLL